MLKNLSSKEVAWILDQIGITLKRHSERRTFLKDITAEKGELSSLLEIKGVFHKVH